jgi:hypothetical protein
MSISAVAREFIAAGLITDTDTQQSGIGPPLPDDA